MEKILEAKNISKQYPGVVALDDVSFNGPIISFITLVFIILEIFILNSQVIN